MYRGKTVGVVVPCHNEELLIRRVIDTMPEYVDRIIIVDDLSTDATADIVEEYVGRTQGRVRLVRHQKNSGVGASIVTGYRAALEEQVDTIATMNGDAQMDPEDLSALLDPLVEGRCDYSKGNRLFTGDAWKVMPRVRYLGNSVLSLLTKIASGYWHIADSQTGYSAATQKVLTTIDLDTIYPRYGYPNDVLVQLNIYNFRVCDVPVKPIYGVGEKSGIRLWKVVPTLSFLLFRRFWSRMFQKYVVRDTHPLVLFYLTGLLFGLVGFILGVLLIIAKFDGRPLPLATVVLSSLLLITGVQFVFFAMWFDMDYNKELHSLR